MLKRSGLDACGRQSWQINDLGWHDITEFPELGTIEIWRFINDSGVSHPMHMHLVGVPGPRSGRIHDRPGGEIIPNGNPQAPPAEESGWKDTALVAPNQILRVIARFEDYKGKYPYHCHILEHEDNEMMRQFESVLCGDGVLDATEECDDGNLSSGDGCYATCDLEDSFALYGAAQGGSVSVTVDGVLVSVVTTAGQTPTQVVQALVCGDRGESHAVGAGDLRGRDREHGWSRTARSACRASRTRACPRLLRCRRSRREVLGSWRS